MLWVLHLQLLAQGLANSRCSGNTCQIKSESVHRSLSSPALFPCLWEPGGKASGGRRRLCWWSCPRSPASDIGTDAVTGSIRKASVLLELAPWGFGSCPCPADLTGCPEQEANLPGSEREVCPAQRPILEDANRHQRAPAASPLPPPQG